jgi:hypothetical protein
MADFPRISVNGELIVSDSEGGFGPDEIMVADVTLSELIAKLFDIPLTARGSIGEYRKLGPVRLSIERLDWGGEAAD